MMWIGRGRVSTCLFWNHVLAITSTQIEDSDLTSSVLGITQLHRYAYACCRMFFQVEEG